MLLFLPFLASLVSAAPVRPTIVDLTHEFGNKTIYWPGLSGFQLEVLHKGPSGGIPWLEMSKYAAPEHGGTHLDAPAHFVKDKWHVDEIPTERLIGPALVIDISSQSDQNPDYELSSDDLQEWERSFGAIDDGSILFIRTGWYRYYSNRTRYLGNADDNAQDLHFPGISEEAAKWLVANRAPVGVGIDTPSMDHGPSSTFLAHRALYTANIYGLENVARLDQLPSRGATVYVSVMKIEHGSGAPVRLIATLDSESGAGAAVNFSWLVLTVSALVVFL